MQIKGMRNLFNEIIAEDLPALCNDINIHTQEAFNCKLV
jgi:hypothetical protein